MRRSAGVLVLLSVFAAPPLALADGLTVFNLDGTLKSGGVAVGTISVYQASGGIVDSHVTVTEGLNTYQFNGGPAHAGSTPSASFEVFTDVAGNDLYLYFPATSVMGSGGPFCSTSLVCGGDVSSFRQNFGVPDTIGFHFVDDPFSSLSASAASPVPEPASVALVLTGLLGVAGAARRRILG